MFGVAAFEFFADFRVGVGPEAGEIAGDLLGTEVGCEEMQQHGDSAKRDSRSLGESEDFLNTDSEDGRSIGSIFEFDAAAAGHEEFFGGFAFDGLELLVVEAGLDCSEPWGVTKFGEGCFVCAEGFEGFEEGAVVEWWEVEFGEPVAKTVGAVDEAVELIVIGGHDIVEL